MYVELHPEADEEVEGAASWYDERQPGLGDEFLSSLDSIFSRLTALPGSFPIWPRLPNARLQIRRALLDRFPYAVAFEDHGNFILVLAVAHTKRRPLYWLTRLATA